VPDSIHGVLMARLDRLDRGPKHALQMASVIGREFALRLLARVVEVGDGVSSLVTELRALELIYEKAGASRARLHVQARAHARRRVREHPAPASPRAAPA
jgi:predicted ATPase